MEQDSTTTTRLASLDAYRGFVMLALAFTSPNWGWQEPIAEAHPALRPLAEQFDHAAWRGLTLWDMIQPSFMFMVGVSLAYSLAARKRCGDSAWRIRLHAARRAIALVALGVFLRSLGQDRTNWTLEDVVTQIGLGYLPLVWLSGLGKAARMAASVVLLAGVWILFESWPSPQGDPAVAGDSGARAAWAEGAGPGRALDRWLLNLPPREAPFLENPGHYYTLNFVPSIATMLLGSLAGDLLKSGRDGVSTLGQLTVAGVALIVVGVALDATGICPMVKRLWTPSFAAASGGLCLLALAAFFGVIDVVGYRTWAWPAEVVGRNPLAMYVMTWTLSASVLANLQTHLGRGVFRVLGDAYAPLLGNLVAGTALWLVCYWMDRQRLYVRL